MRLQDIFDQLSSGEFSQLSIGGAAQGVIDETNYAKVLGHINLGLVALYRRFNLKEGQLVLRLQANQTTYKLNSAYAVNARRSTEPVRYIIDTVDEPFSDDIIKVERVLDEQGVSLPLNDASDPTSVTTPSTKALFVPEDIDLQDLTVVYRAMHPKITVGLGYFDPTRVEVQLPDTHLAALLYYVASRVNNPIGVVNEFHAGNTYAAKYEAECAELEGKGLQVDLTPTNTRAQRGGWV